MHLLNAVMATSMLTALGQSNDIGNEIPFGTVEWYLYAGLSCFLVLFAGIMSGLTLGLMSLGLVDLEILQRSGTPAEKKQAGYLFYSTIFSFFFALIVNLPCDFIDFEL